MDWDKIEKARKGLRTCVESEDIGCPLSCPYYEPCMADPRHIYSPMMNDVLTEYERMMEQIKALEAARIPRVMTPDEAKQKTRGMPVIVERLHRGCEYMLCTGMVNNGIALISCIFVGLNLHWPDYDRKWRIWTAFPSLDDRKAVAWDE